MDAEKVPENKKSLKTGYTTGACAAAATKAATLALITQYPVKNIEINLPIGKKVTFAVIRCDLSSEEAQAEVIKDAGDDPDCTHGAHIISTVRRAESGIGIFGGEGVGTGGQFLHQIRRAETRDNFFRICREFLDHDQPAKLEPANVP